MEREGKGQDSRPVGACSIDGKTENRVSGKWVMQGPEYQRIVNKEQVSSGGWVRTHREIQPTVGTVALNLRKCLISIKTTHMF